MNQEREKAFQLAMEGMITIRDKGIDAARMYLDYSAQVFSFMLSIDGNHLIPPEVRSKWAIHHYANHGDSYRNICSEVKKSLKFRPADWDKDMPEAIKGREFFTVYRAGIEDATEAANHISWTIFKDVAMWFAAKYVFENRGQLHVYKGIIPAKKVIAYIDDRYEFEIVQNKSVENIVEIPMEDPSDAFMEIMSASQIACGNDDMKSYVNAQLSGN